MNHYECVKLIQNLPDDLIESHGIILAWNETSDFDKIINTLRLQYRANADWLKYYLCGHSELYFELTYSLKAKFKPLGERSMAFYNLAMETYLLSDVMQQMKLEPIELLYLIEKEICKNVLNNSGITAKAKVIGKENIYNDTKLICANLENPKDRTYFKYGKIHTWIDFLIDEVLKITSVPENVDFRLHFHKFLRSVRQCDDKMRRQSNIQIGYLDSGTLNLVSGLGKRATKRKK